MAQPELRTPRRSALPPTRDQQHHRASARLHSRPARGRRSKHCSTAVAATSALLHMYACATTAAAAAAARLPRLLSPTEPQASAASTSLRAMPQAPRQRACRRTLSSPLPPFAVASEAAWAAAAAVPKCRLSRGGRLPIACARSAGDGARARLRGVGAAAAAAAAVAVAAAAAAPAPAATTAAVYAADAAVTGGAAARSDRECVSALDVACCCCRCSAVAPANAAAAVAASAEAEDANADRGTKPAAPLPLHAVLCPAVAGSGGGGTCVAGEGRARSVEGLPLNTWPPGHPSAADFTCVGGLLRASIFTAWAHFPPPCASASAEPQIANPRGSSASTDRSSVDRHRRAGAAVASAGSAQGRVGELGGGSGSGIRRRSDRACPFVVRSFARTSRRVGPLPSCHRPKLKRSRPSGRPL
eukprot:365486-Chlamydomonas_euryale.AAC.12